MGILTRHRFGALGALLLTCCHLFARSGASPREYDVKAVFLYNFAMFVEWPDTAFADENAPIVIGVLGENTFGPVLAEVAAGERVKNRPIAIRQFRDLEDAVRSHILFISPSEAHRRDEIIRFCARRPLLLVADLPGFAEAGGTVGFRTEESRLRLDINLAAARAAGLAVSSKLLKVARVIEEEAVP